MPNPESWERRSGTDFGDWIDNERAISSITIPSWERQSDSDFGDWTAKPKALPISRFLPLDDIYGRIDKYEAIGPVATCSWQIHCNKAMTLTRLKTKQHWSRLHWLLSMVAWELPKLPISEGHTVQLCWPLGAQKHNSWGRLLDVTHTTTKLTS